MSHVGVERSRIWNEVTALGRELPRLKPIIGTRVPADVAIMLEGTGKPSADVRMLDQLKA